MNCSNDRQSEALPGSCREFPFKTQHRFKEVYEAIQALMTDPVPKQRAIGFTADLEPQ